MRNRERGQLFILVLILLGVGALLLIPALNIASTGLFGKQVRTDTLNQQYTRDAGAEFAIWQLMYGGADVLLAGEGQEAAYSINLNGEQAAIIIRMKATLGQSSVPGAEDNRIRVTKTVECARDGDGVFNDDCTALPAQTGMVARYTVSLDQVAPVEVPPVGVTTIYDELPKGFTLVPGSVTSLDGSLPEIVGIAPQNIGSSTNEIWKWQFASPIYILQGTVKQFTFLASINKNRDRYCNQAFLKLEAPPNEKSAKVAPIAVGANPPQACDNAGAQAFKYVDTRVAPPNRTTVFTYIISISSIDQNTLQVQSVKDVLPQGPFVFCNPSSPPPQNDPPDVPPLACDQPMYKAANDPFDPATGSFTDTTGFTPLADPVQTLVDGRWELFFNGAWSLAGAGQAGDNLIFRFQAWVIPTLSGSYYNEFFVDINCAAPQPLITEGVTTAQDYCASYSWPSGGTIVPTYDVKSSVGNTTGQGNVDIDWSGGTGDAQLNSWHIN